MKKCDITLYLVTGFLESRGFFAKVEQAIEAGVTCVQLRDKNISAEIFENTSTPGTHCSSVVR